MRSDVTGIAMIVYTPLHHHGKRKTTGYSGVYQHSWRFLKCNAMDCRSGRFSHHCPSHHDAFIVAPDLRALYQPPKQPRIIHHKSIRVHRQFGRKIPVGTLV